MSIKVVILSTVAGFGGAERVVKSILNSINEDLVNVVGVFFTKPGEESEKLANALKNANLKSFAKTRADAHDLADTAEALVAYVWLSKNIALHEIINFLSKNFFFAELDKRLSHYKKLCKLSKKNRSRIRLIHWQY